MEKAKYIHSLCYELFYVARNNKQDHYLMIYEQLQQLIPDIKIEIINNRIHISYKCGKILPRSLEHVADYLHVDNTI